MKIYWQGNSTILVDVSGELPKHKNYPFNWRKSARYYDIKDRKVKRAVLHQHAGGYTPGFAGVMETANFFVRDPLYDDQGNWKGNGRGWPGFAYTIDVPFAPETQDGKYLVYLCNNFDTVSWHTSGWNADGVGVAFQGYFKSRHLKRFVPSKGQTGRPSQIQIEILGDLWDNFLKPKFSLTDKDIYGHFEAPGSKPTCPGDDLEEWILKKRQVSRRTVEVAMPPAQVGDFNLTTWELRQAALVAAGCDIGDSGPKKNGVDGDPGYRTRLGIEAIERASGLKSDGAWDAEMENALCEILISLGIAQKDIADLT